MCDCEEPKAFREEIRIARKQHKCCECHNKIEKGEGYQFCSGVWDYPDSFKSCLSCADVREEMASEYDCCIAFGQLIETISENSFYSGYGLKEFVKDCFHPAEKFYKLFNEEMPKEQQ